MTDVNVAFSVANCTGLIDEIADRHQANSIADIKNSLPTYSYNMAGRFLLIQGKSYF